MLDTEVTGIQVGIVEAGMFSYIICGELSVRSLFE